jgi:hypothetical protein
MSGIDPISETYKKKLAFFVEQERDYYASRQKEEVSLRYLAHLIDRHLKKTGLSLSYTILTRWAGFGASIPPRKTTFDAIAKYKGVSVERLRKYFEDDRIPVKQTPWKTGGSSIPSVEEVEEFEEKPARLARPGKPIDLIDAIESADHREIAAAASIFFERLFADAQVFVTIVPQEDETEIQKFPIELMVGNNVLDLEQDFDLSGNGKIAEYVHDLLAEHGRNPETDQFVMSDLLNRVDVYLGSDPSKKIRGLEAIRSVLDGSKLRFENEEEDFIPALASALTLLLGATVQASHLQALNNGELESCSGTQNGGIKANHHHRQR